MIKVSTGGLGNAYEVLDAIFAIDSSTKGLLTELDPEKAFEGVKLQLRERCKVLGGHAVVHCQFEYRNALADGFLGKKQSLEIFGYGTAVRFVDPQEAARVEAYVEPWQEEALALLSAGKKVEAVRIVREKGRKSLAEALEVVSSWER